MQHNQSPGPEHRFFAEGEAIVHKVAWGIRDMGDAFLQMLESIGSSRELNLAKTKVEEAVMWATKGVTGSFQVLVAPQPTSIRSILLDIYDRIAAAVTALKSGDNSALQAHVAQIDQHLASLDQNDTDEQTRLNNIEAGIAKIADAAAPADTTGSTTGAGTGSDASGAGTGTDTSGSGGAPADPTA